MAEALPPTIRVIDGVNYIPQGPALERNHLLAEEGCKYRDSLVRVRKKLETMSRHVSALKLQVKAQQGLLAALRDGTSTGPFFEKLEMADELLEEFHEHEQEEGDSTEEDPRVHP